MAASEQSSSSTAVPSSDRHLLTVNITTLPPIANWTVSEKDREFQGRLLVARNVIVPLLVAVGLVGNTLSLLVFTRGHFKHMSSSKYLAALAVTDNVFLSTLFITWLHDFVPVMTSAGVCKVVIFLSYTASYLSVCFVLCCTSERYVAVCHPLRAQYIFSKVPAKAVVAVLITSAVTMYCCSLWTTTVSRYQHGFVCHADLDYLHVMRVLTWADTVLTMILPFVLLLVMNSCIAVAVCRFYARRNQSFLALSHAEACVSAPLCHSAQQAARSSHKRCGRPFNPRSHLLVQQRSRVSNKGNDDYNNSSRSSLFRSPSANIRQVNESGVEINERQRGSRCLTRQLSRGSAFLSHFQLRTTRTLLLVSVTFLVLNLPSHVLRLRQLLYVSEGGAPTLQEALVQEVAQLTYYSTFALNFFLYTMYGRHFQQALGDLASRGRHVVKACCCSGSARHGARSDSSSGRDVPVYRPVHSSRTASHASSTPARVPQHPAQSHDGLGATRV